MRKPLTVAGLASTYELVTVDGRAASCAQPLGV